MRRLTHTDRDGRVQMVDVARKPLSKRTAVACGKIHLQHDTLELIAKDQIAKGDVFATARIAGIQAAKQTAQLIPLCHTVPIGEVKIDIVTVSKAVEVRCTARTIAQTGVEMEALTAVSVAALTLYDMCKAIDRRMVIGEIRLESKTGGRSGDYRRGET